MGTARVLTVVTGLSVSQVFTSLLLRKLPNGTIGPKPDTEDEEEDEDEAAEPALELETVDNCEPSNRIDLIVLCLPLDLHFLLQQELIKPCLPSRNQVDPQAGLYGHRCAARA